MKRAYLEEDLGLIRKYFPGAQAVALHTPFDLRDAIDPWQAQVNNFRADEIEEEWYGGLLWNQS